LITLNSDGNTMRTPSLIPIGVFELIVTEYNYGTAYKRKSLTGVIVVTAQTPCMAAIVMLFLSSSTK